MEVFDAIVARASVRSYTERPVPDEQLEKLVDAGRRAPTARGVEPWEFVVITEKETLEELGRTADHGPFITGASACIAVYCAPTKYYLEDGCAATENILIAASAEGIGGCWVAGDKKEYAGRVSEILGVPDELKLVSLISLGWPRDRVTSSRKRSLREVIHKERF